jgi:lipopolysaccharide/colanic/teichoic acid biosynthesis glycosyltransferase
MLKRLLDLTLSIIGLLFAFPLIFLLMFLVWMQDKHAPLYIAPRVGKDGRIFQMVKLRSMIFNADQSGITSTANTDARITPLGFFIRRYKIDELTQLWNVLKGDMSLVGPRPQVRSAVDKYTSKELGLLSVRPGITDFASIVFADEGAILEAQSDPDASYDQLIRPGKSSLGIFYVNNRSFFVDLSVIGLTFLSFFYRQKALDTMQFLLSLLGADRDLVELSGRKNQLVPQKPPS